MFHSPHQRRSPNLAAGDPLDLSKIDGNQAPVYSQIIRGILVSFLKWDLACDGSLLSTFCRSLPFPPPFLWATPTLPFTLNYKKKCFKAKKEALDPILEKAAPAYVKDLLMPGKESDLGLTQGRELPSESSLTGFLWRSPGFLWRSPIRTPT